jgi:hypothetical protein
VSEHTTTQSVLFPGIFERPVVAKFDQAHGSSDGGAVLLKAADRELGLIATLATCLKDAVRGVTSLWTRRCEECVHGDYLPAGTENLRQRLANEGSLRNNVRPDRVRLPAALL